MKYMLIANTLLWLSLPTLAQKNIPFGVWEGISRSGAQFKVLKISADNQHSITSYNIASGMQISKKIKFTNKDIHCDEFNCQIFSRMEEESLPLKITLTEFVKENYLVTEAVKLDSGEILSSSYKLVTTNATPTPERFIAKEAKKLADIVPKHQNHRFGYWSGILESTTGSRLKFATLEYIPGRPATFTVYSPGLHGEAVMTFEPEWLIQNNGELTTKVEGAPFASKITLRYLTRRTIDGDFEQRFERYPEQLMAYGHFQLTRVKPRKMY